MIKDAVVRIILGPPCSGKSTYIRAFQFDNPGFARFSPRDFLKMMNSPLTIPETNEIIFGSIMNMVGKVKKVIIEGFPSSIYILERVMVNVETVDLVILERELPYCVKSNQSREEKIEIPKLKEAFIQFKNNINGSYFREVSKKAHSLTYQQIKQVESLVL